MPIEWGVAPKQKDLIFGLDLGQVGDYTALTVANRSERPDGATYAVGHLERWRGERYPAIVRLVQDRIRRADVFPAEGGPRPTIRLAIDHTGVGRPVFDMFLDADLGIPITGVTITSGQQVTKNDDGYGVPKRVLASTVAVLLHSGRLEIASTLPDAAVLSRELNNFKVKINARGHDSYGAGDDWRESENKHDDLVLGLSLALWLGEHGSGGNFEQISGELAGVLAGLGL